MKDHQLIFLISLPRSGSTLLQKVLGTHKAVATGSEPWLMLHPLSVFRENAILADYDHTLASKGVCEFLGSGIELTPEKKGAYLNEFREPFLRMYSAHLDNGGVANRFLDKTPRYYLIFDELLAVFPNAKFIVLGRNPLAILSSILTTWAHNDLSKLDDYRVDLVEGLNFMLRDFSKHTNVCRVTYENFVAEPEKELALLQNFLEIEEDLTCLNYDSSNVWRYGDQRTVYTKTKPDKSHSKDWVNRFSDPRFFSIAKQYLDSLGEDKLARIGYSFSGLSNMLDAHEHSNVLESTDSILGASYFELEDYRETTRAQFSARSLSHEDDSYLMRLQCTTSSLNSVRDELETTKSIAKKSESEIASKLREIQSMRSILETERSNVKSMTKQYKNAIEVLDKTKSALASSNRECEHLRKAIAKLRHQLEHKGKVG